MIGVQIDVSGIGRYKFILDLDLCLTTITDKLKLNLEQPQIMKLCLPINIVSNIFIC
jgi:hypothetical protein